MNNILINSLWVHTNGNKYTVICIANEYSENLIKYPITVVYRGENNRIWSRPLNDWHRSMTLLRDYDGKD